MKMKMKKQSDSSVAYPLYLLLDIPHPAHDTSWKKSICRVHRVTRTMRSAQAGMHCSSRPPKTLHLPVTAAPSHNFTVCQANSIHN